MYVMRYFVLHRSQTCFVKQILCFMDWRYLVFAQISNSSRLRHTARLGVEIFRFTQVSNQVEHDYGTEGEQFYIGANACISHAKRGIRLKRAQMTGLNGDNRGKQALKKEPCKKRKVLISPSSFVVISLSGRNNSGHANDRCEKTQASNNADDKQRNRLLYKQKWL